MSKKLIAIAALLIVFIVLPVYLYFYFSPEDTNNIKYTRTANDSQVYADFFANLKQNEGEQLIYLKDSNEDNSYLESGIIYSVLEENEGENLSVDFKVLDTASEKDLTVTQLKDKFSIETVPALVIVNVEGNKLNVVNTLAYHDDQPFTKDNFKTWLFENHIWVGPYLDASDLN